MLRQSLLLACLIFAGSAFADSAKVLFKEKCAQCHGLNAEGNDLLNAPTLASQSSLYISEQLHKFKKGIRGGDAKVDAVASLMSQQAKTLQESEIKLLAQYLSKLDAPKRGGVENESAQRGEKIYQKQANCISCHGDYGQGNDSMKAPKLNILPAAYIELELKKFAKKQRGLSADKDPHGYLMVKTLKDYALSEKDFKDLATFISTLRKPKEEKK